MPSQAQGHPGFTTTDDAYIQDLYRREVHDQDIEAFLNETDTYDTTKKRWSVSETPTTRTGVVDFACKVICSAIKTFAKPAQAGVERDVVGMQGYDTVVGVPALVVRAAGPSFEIPNPQSLPSSLASNIGYGNIASYFSVKLDRELGSAKENADEMETYARRIFREQPNRIHVRSLVITEKHARLVHFDRSGPQVTPLIDIHQNPGTFVRLLAGLTSTDERTLGLDDSIQWTIVDGRKGQGMLSTTGPSGERKAYPILEHLPIPRAWMFGRGTTCWRVQDPDTSEELVVKDSWRPGDHPAEHELLELVKGIPGVVQMVAYETGRGETRDFRCHTTYGKYHNRTATRVTMKSYGRSIECFKSPLQLLCALRDAIAGHQRLVGDDLRILHRDISQNNVLLGRDGAPDGERGVLIDFDLAFRATDEHPVTSVDHNTGTRVFQSLPVLESCSMKCNKYQHDYLDDLESFLYVLSYLFLVFRPDGSLASSKEEGPSIIWSWGAKSPEDAASNKDGLFGYGEDAAIASEVIREYWGPACLALFEQFREWVQKMTEEKYALIFESLRHELPELLNTLHDHRDEHYAVVLKMFDDAIDKTRAEPAAHTPLPSGGAAPSKFSSLTATMNENAPAPAHDDRGKFDSVRDTVVDNGATGSMGSSRTDQPFIPETVCFVVETSNTLVESHTPQMTASIGTTRSAPPAVALSQPRRSTRLHNLRLAKGEQPPFVLNAPPPAKPSVSPSPIPVTQVHRSAHLSKRHVEDEAEHPEAPQFKARRVTQRPRAIARSR